MTNKLPPNSTRTSSILESLDDSDGNRTNVPVPQLEREIGKRKNGVNGGGTVEHH